MSPEETQKELLSIAEGLKLMVSVTNDMTDLQKLRAGQFAVHLAPTSLREVLRSCISAVMPAVPRPDDILLECADDVPDQV